MTRMTFNKRHAAFAALVVAGVLGLAPAARAQTTEAKTFNDWKVVIHDGKPAKVCFAVSEPKTLDPGDGKRKRAFFYVSSWPKDGVKAEVSVNMGFELRPNVQIAVTVGSATFNLFAKDDKAFVADATDELKLIESMKRGSTMIVRGMAADGGQTTDTYSLSGITAALRNLQQSCS